MTDGSPPIVLNANQRRHFEVLFARLEDALVRVEWLLGPGPSRPQVLSIFEDDVPDAFRAHAAPILLALREEIAQLGRALGLHPRRQSRSRTIAATLGTEAIRLEDSMSGNLRGYGEVDPSVARQLDPVLGAMARSLNELAAALRHRGSSSRGR